MKYKILILSNSNNKENIEDVYMKERFEKDGNIVDMKWIDYNSELDDNYDLIIRRDTWIETPKEMEFYKKINQILIHRLRNSNKTINLIGLDGQGKEYLKDLYNKEMNVIPTTDKVYDALEWNTEEYVLKLKDSFGSGLGQLFVDRNELIKEYDDKYLIQPKINFKSELQVYFINNKLMYAYEYTPSKYPNYPEPALTELTIYEKKLAEEFSDISPIKVGMKRIDFLRLNDNSLILLEIEDNSPHMNLETLDEKTRNDVLDYFVKGIYRYICETK